MLLVLFLILTAASCSASQLLHTQVMMTSSYACKTWVPFLPALRFTCKYNKPSMYSEVSSNFRSRYHHVIRSTLTLHGTPTMNYMSTNDDRESSSKGNQRPKIRSPNILALDFDGVVCASSDESSISSIYASNNEWPSLCYISKDTMEFQLFKSIINAVRPIVETGFENILLVRYVYEQYQAAAFNRNTIDDHHNELVQAWKQGIIHDILNTWNNDMRDELLLRYNRTKAELITSFGNARDNMIKSELNYWISLNKLYPTVSNSLRSISLPPSVDDTNRGEDNKHNSDYDVDEFYIVTTKEQRFVKAILEGNGLYLINNGRSNSIRSSGVVGNTSDGDDHDSSSMASNIFDLHNIYGKKLNVLQHLSADYLRRNQCLPKIHFVEDRYETLLGVIHALEIISNSSSTSLEPNEYPLDVVLYLADWGYNTPEQRAAARSNKYITVISQHEFSDLMNLLYSSDI